MASDQTTHVLESIEAYLAGGLTPDERVAFDAHVQSCATCAAKLTKAREADSRLRGLFGDARPAPGFEDRVIRQLRSAPIRRWPIVHPMVRRVAVGVAAAVVLTGSGVIVRNALDGNRRSITSTTRQFGLVDVTEFGRYRNAVQHASQPSEVDVLADGGVQLALHARSDLGLKDKVRELKRSGGEELGKAVELNYGFGEHRDSYSFRPQEQLGRAEQDEKKSAEGRVLREVAGAKRGEKPAISNEAADFLADKTQDMPMLYLRGAAATQPGGDSSGVPQANAISGRKVIRNGMMQFEVDRFDDALLRITKLVVEQGGFVATTDSDKLPNGKMKGTVTLRVPPEHLDSLVLTLRGIGDLKSQKIGAEDVTKHYTDLESELRAARAMQDRLIEIIKTGKGQIKDLLEAEKQLGVWREKIEQIEGEKRYLDNQITLSTLRVELFERDIQTASFASETEQVNMSLETEKVDEAYEKARAAIETAKGRILQAEMKQYDAGQFGATIQAAIPPDAAEQVIARLRQLPGRIAHFARESKRTTQNGAAPMTGVTSVHREDVVVSMQIYNLANIAPRRTITATLATPTVDHTYQQVLGQIRSAGGRVVTSSLTRPDSNQQAAEVDFQVPADKSDSLDDALRGLGEIMRHDAAENPDTANVTEAKRGFHLKIVSTAAVAARETQEIQLAAADVPAAYNEILGAVNSAGGRVLQSDLKEQDPHDKTASIVFEMPRPAAGAVNAAIAKAAQVMTRTISRSADAENTLDSKLRLALSLGSAEKLPPRQTTTVRQEVSDVERSADDLTNAAMSAGGRRIGSGDVNQDQAGHMTARVIVDVPMDKAASMLDQVERSGRRRVKQVSFDSTIPDGPLTRARLDVTFSNSAASLGGDESTWDAIRHGLETSALGLRWSLQMLIIGVCFVAPWVLVVWAIWKMARRRPRAVPTSA